MLSLSIFTIYLFILESQTQHPFSSVFPLPYEVFGRGFNFTCSIFLFFLSWVYFISYSSYFCLNFFSFVVLLLHMVLMLFLFPSEVHFYRLLFPIFFDTLQKIRTSLHVSYFKFCFIVHNFNHLPYICIKLVLIKVFKGCYRSILGRLSA
jgi:hypothetical protein